MEFGKEEWKEIDFPDVLTRQELINKLFDEFDKDKDIIKRNLLEVMDIIHLETKDKYGKLTLTIKYERNDDNDKTSNNN